MLRTATQSVHPHFINPVWTHTLFVNLGTWHAGCFSLPRAVGGPYGRRGNLTRTEVPAGPLEEPMRTSYALGAVAVVCLTHGCSPTPVAEPTAETGASLTVDFLGGTDVVGFRFDLSRVACYENEAFDAWSDTADVELADMTFPGMVPSQVDSPLDGVSHHIAADYFVTLAPGCYSVTATPLDAQNEPSSECNVASTPLVAVNAGETTSVMLISQCAGDSNGAINTTVGLNHPPTIEVVSYDPSKWLFECQIATVCATAHDVDGDPIEMEWSVGQGPGLFDGPDVVSSEFSMGPGATASTLTECVEIVPQWTADYTLSVTAYDLVGDGSTFEEYLATQGNPADSHATIEVPFHVNWEQELQCWNENTNCFHYLPGVEPFPRAQGCNWTTPAAFFCSDTYASMFGFDKDFTCPNGTFAPAAVYPICQ